MRVQARSRGQRSGGGERAAIRSACLCLALGAAALAGATPVGAPGADAGPRLEPVDLGAYAAVRHVAPTGSDRRGDGSADRPWATIGRALAAGAGATAERRVAVLAASGTYREHNLRLRPYVDLFGGFTRSGWRRGPMPDSVLEAERQGRVLLGADHARVDGFTLRGGRADSPGGGVLCDRTSPVLTNNVFYGNATRTPGGYLRGMLHQVGADGGAVAVLNYGSPRIESNLFLDNSTEIGGGGAIGMRSASVRPAEEIPPVLVRRNVFVLNRTGTADNHPDVKKRDRSSNGGALSLSNYLALIEDNLFVQNRVGGNSDGGGIYCEYEASPVIRRNHFVGNVGEDDGGAIYAMKLSEPVIENNLFSGNVGGGAIRFSKEGRGVVRGNLFFDNPAGGVFASGAWMVVEGNVIADNGNAGVMVSGRKEYFRPAVVRRNQVFGNKGEQIQADARELLAATGNTLQAPASATPTPTHPGSPAEFDPRVGRSRILLAADPAPLALRPGRVIRVGSRWGAVYSHSGRVVTAWGDLRSPNSGPALSYLFPGDHLRSLPRGSGSGP